MKALAVTDATPLIHLAKIDRLDILASFYANVLVPATVHREITGGQEKNIPEIIALNRKFKEGFLERKRDPRVPQDVPATLGEGERRAIALALRQKCDLLVDDRDAHVVARSLGVRSRRTTALLLEGVTLGLWNAQRFEFMLRRLTQSGYFLTADLYQDLVEHARKLERKG